MSKTNIFCIIVFILSSSFHSLLILEEYEYTQQEHLAKVTKIEKDCGRSCYYYALVEYKGYIQEINIGRSNFHYMKEGRSYDFTPSFSWLMGINGTAYSIDEETIWYKGLTMKIASLFLSIALLISFVIDLFTFFDKKINNKTISLHRSIFDNEEKTLKGQSLMDKLKTERN